MRAGLAENAKGFRDLWEREKIWEKLTSRSPEKKYILHDGPPYANGHIHLGHALNKILKDFVLRHRALTGHRIHYVPGWDTHGLPIENRLERGGNWGELGPLERRERCRGYALSQIEVQREQFRSLHLLCDFREIYRTLDDSYVNRELEIFGKFVEMGLVYWDLKPVAWSWSSGTALAESEIVHREVECTAVEFWFPSAGEFGGMGEGVRLPVWTTTPYTLEANLALCLNPEMVYELVEWEGARWISMESKIPGRVLERFEGRRLEGLEYRNPLTGEIHRIILGDHVTADAGTGMVHTAPGFGPEDFRVCRKYSIGVHCAVDGGGRFTESSKFKPLVGLFYAEASAVVIDWLRENGYLLREERMVHRVGHDWRTEKPLMYRASAQWFIDLEPLKPKIKEWLGAVEGLPP